jgi:hypothetical protein
MGTGSHARNTARTIALHEPGFEDCQDSEGGISPFWDATEDEGEQEEPLHEKEEATKMANEASIQTTDDVESEEEETTGLANPPRRKQNLPPPQQQLGNTLQLLIMSLTKCFGPQSQLSSKSTDWASRA